jgi:Carboxypeptidase regulatory-like domain
MKAVQGKGKFLIALVTLLLSLSLLSWSQTGTSAVRGTITDPQGRVVTGAEVTLTNQENAAVRSMTTTDSGGFNFDLITPGSYRLEVVAKGFKKQTVDNVRAFIGKPSEASIQLEVGAATEVVEVQGVAAGFLVNTQDASLGNNIDSQQITQLPLESKNLNDLLTLQPGSTREGYVTGARADQSNVTLDGVDINNAQTGNAEIPRTTNTLVIGQLDTSRGNITTGPVLRLNTEAIEEFRVTTANGNANQGRSSGSQINLSTKSGGNAFHGSAFENYRTKGFTANDWFNNHSGAPRQDLIRHAFNGRLGGPIVKDKVFFFYDYDGVRVASSTGETRVVPLTTSPDPLNPGTLGDGVIHYSYCADPACDSTAIASLDSTQLQQAYSAAGINPAAQGVFADSVSKFKTNDASQGDGLNTGGFRFNAPTPVKLNQHVAKFDFNLTKSQAASVRLTAQQDHQTLPEWLPGSPSPQVWSHPWGLAVGHTWTIGQNWVNSFRYGYTRQAFTQGGDSFGNDVEFRFVYQPTGESHSQSRVTPVHNFTDDISWIHGSHSLQFGTNIRSVSNSRVSFANAFDFATTNPSWYANGAGDSVSGAFQAYLDNNPSLPGSGGLLVSTAEVQNAATALIGRLNEYSSFFTFKKDGSIFPAGSPSTRDFASQAYDMYFQDSWKARPNLTLTFGLRYSLEKPVYEKAGFQVSPTVPLGTYFADRLAAAANGQNFTDPIVLNLGGPANHGRPMYNWDYKNFQPRVAFAWSPAGSSGKSVVRGGFAITSDYYGQALAVDFDLNNTLGFTSSANVNANTFDIDPTNTGSHALAPQFSAFGQDIQSLLPAANLGTPQNLMFPLSQPSDQGLRIEQSVDSNLVAPKQYVWNLTFEREMRAGLVLSASYIGRKGQHLLARRDVAAFNDLRDPTSGMDWYQAGTLLEKQRQQGVDTSQIATIPYFENLFPAGMASMLNSAIGFPGTDPNDCSAAGANLGFDPAWSNTQAFYAMQSRTPVNCAAVFAGNDWTDTQAFMDYGVFAPAGLPTMFTQPQYGALSTWSTIGNANYHAFTFSARQRYHGLILDFNYTWSHSMDDGSGLQSDFAYSGGFITNPIRQRNSYATSDFDTKHSINASGVWELPFGRGHAFLGSAHPVADAIFGGWQLSSVFRWNTGLPVSPSPYDDSRWATNWNVQAAVSPTSRVTTCPTRSTVGDPKLFGCADLTKIYQSFRNAYPGETGPRNTYRMPGYVDVDFGFGKTWKMPWHEGHTLQIRWDAFNVANHQSFGAIDNSRTGFGVVRDPALRGALPPSNWSNFIQIAGQARVMQVSARYAF